MTRAWMKRERQRREGSKEGCAERGKDTRPEVQREGAMREWKTCQNGKGKGCELK